MLSKLKICVLYGLEGHVAYYKFENRPIKRDDPIEQLVLDIYNKSLEKAGYRLQKKLAGMTPNLYKKSYNIILKNSYILCVPELYTSCGAPQTVLEKSRRYV